MENKGRTFFVGTTPYPIRPGSFGHGESGTHVVPTDGDGMNEVVELARRYRVR